MRILGILLLIFVGFPFLEIYLFIQVAKSIGTLATLGLTLAAMAVGIFLIRYQGILTFMRVRESLLRGEAPAMALLEGLMMLLSGFLFLIPGFFTDFLALLLTIPLLRRTLIRSWLRRSKMVRRSSASGSTIIEGEFRREDDHTKIEGRGPSKKE